MFNRELEERIKDLSGWATHRISTLQSTQDILFRRTEEYQDKLVARDDELTERIEKLETTIKDMYRKDLSLAKGIIENSDRLDKQDFNITGMQMKEALLVDATKENNARLEKLEGKQESTYDMREAYHKVYEDSQALVWKYKEEELFCELRQTLRLAVPKDPSSLRKCLEAIEALEESRKC